MEIGSIDNCLKLFKPDIDPKAILPKTTFAPSQFPKGQVTRAALEILREIGHPMSTPELAACVPQRLEAPITDKALKRVASTIQGNFSRRPDRIVTFDRETYPGKWRLNVVHS